MSTADEIAISVFGWLANEPELLGRFLALTGTDLGSLRSSVNDPAFLAGLLDFLMGHEPTLMAFCTATDTRPEDVVKAHRHFAGPDYSGSL
ncbi:DUF3572 domain-containing protein [Pararhizobium sp.]|uniref:DUF3572 domain-containing protein n=1 Tax=Pararhizobium sp. TaxID=1977563 RepID=UPI0027159366|nr:DUF3572 domain-containing protein [Pararhizobium sp.]MDO9415903.1 DUF3572 domain-containing protein [Pararhizobium sp.]